MTRSCLFAEVVAFREGTPPVRDVRPGERETAVRGEEHEDPAGGDTARPSTRNTDVAPDILTAREQRKLTTLFSEAFSATVRVVRGCKPGWWGTREVLAGGGGLDHVMGGV